MSLAFFFSLLLVPLAVQTAHIDPKDNDDEEFDKMAGNHAPNPHPVRWRLIRLVEERPGNVPSTVSEK